MKRCWIRRHAVAYTILTSCIALGACATGTPRIAGTAAAPPAQGQAWQGPVPVIPNVPVSAATAALTAADLQTLTMAQVIDIALSTNPATRISWAQARGAAADYGAARSQWLPRVVGDVTASQSQTPVASGTGGSRWQYGPGVSLSWLLLDFGGRSGSIDAAREIAIAANLDHNAVLQNTVLDVQSAIFAFMATRALRDAQQIALREAEAALTAAEERRRVGLATIADVLQARTARSSVQLRLETLEGQLSISRGGVAVSMGLPANTNLDIPQVSVPDSIVMVTTSVDNIIAIAVRTRPDLAAAQAEALAAGANVRVARSAQLPALTVGGNSGYTRASTGANGGSYNITFGVDLPLFSGFRDQYRLRASQDASIEADARTQLTRQQVIFQVFASYYDLQTATNHVRTAADLLASATESEQVALGRYREGVGTIVDLLIAQTALANARAENVQAHWEWRAALARLAHDAGVIGLDGSTAIPTTGTR